MDCLLCRSSNIRVEDQLAGRDIVALWRAAGRVFSPEALLPIQSGTAVKLFRCGDCGFRCYDPSLAGSGRFYSELMAKPYYADVRDEFLFALTFAASHQVKSVLDVGGGEGGFLDLARQRGLTTSGLELNEVAADRCAAKGHRMLRKSFENVTPGEVDGGVDLLTLFQVIEHVPDPVAFLKAAVPLVREGGFITVAVPNEHRVYGWLPYDPANWPPHHISRWRRQDLRALGARAGLKVVAEGADRLYGSAFDSLIADHCRLAAAIGRRAPGPSPGIARLLSFLYRKLGFKYFAPRRGLSIYVMLQKPHPDGAS